MKMISKISAMFLVVCVTASLGASIRARRNIIQNFGKLVLDPPKAAAQVFFNSLADIANKQQADLEAEKQKGESQVESMMKEAQEALNLLNEAVAIGKDINVPITYQNGLVENTFPLGSSNVLFPTDFSSSLLPEEFNFFDINQLLPFGSDFNIPQFGDFFNLKDQFEQMNQLVVSAQAKIDEYIEELKSILIPELNIDGIIDLSPYQIESAAVTSEQISPDEAKGLLEKLHELEVQKFLADQLLNEKFNQLKEELNRYSITSR